MEGTSQFEDISNGVKNFNHVPEIDAFTKALICDSIIKTRIRSKEEMPKMYEASKMIRFLEFFIGVTGTLIWGFGDVIFN